MFLDDFLNEKREELESRIIEIFKEAEADLSGKTADYFSKLTERIEKEREVYERGVYTDEQFRAWLLAQLARGERWKHLKNDMSQRIVEAAQLAEEIINSSTPVIYSEAHNFNAYVIETEFPTASFNLVDENTVRNLIERKTKFNLYKKVGTDIKKITKYSNDRLESAITQGVLQGESISKVADRLNDVAKMNRSCAVANARTCMTSAYNAGHQSAFEEAEQMGIPVQKKWLATKDERTRPSHRDADGEVRPVAVAFSNGLMYPGDMNGKPEEVFRCRCTMCNADLTVSGQKMRVKNPAWLKAVEEKRDTAGIPKTLIIDEMSYREWEKWKKSESENA